MDDEALEKELAAMRPAVPRHEFVERLSQVTHPHAATLAERFYAAWTLTAAVAACVIFAIALWQLVPLEPTAGRDRLADKGSVPVNPIAVYEKLFAEK